MFAEREIFTLPGFNVEVPCNHEDEDITWVLSISNPVYTWTRPDGSPAAGNHESLKVFFNNKYRVSIDSEARNIS